MKRTIRIQLRAQDDLRRQAEFIAKDSLDAALRLLEAAEITYEFLAETPLAGAVCPFKSVQTKNLRIWRINGFPECRVHHRRCGSSRRFRVDPQF